MEIINLNNPHNLEDTLSRLRGYLASNDQYDALALLDKGIRKSDNDENYSKRMEEALLYGSTVECRSLFSDFGNYWERSRAEYPFYPHHDAVNSIDTALHHLKLGVIDKECGHSVQFCE